ncbi:MAG: membrane protein insertion efficiency factor YidD [bacterium JZ-2024 1]
MLNFFALKVIEMYQKFVSPLLPRVCRYEPTCSEYMRLALLKYGFWKGFFIGLKRLLRCHPFGGGGIDPVP